MQYEYFYQLGIAEFFDKFRALIKVERGGREPYTVIEMHACYDCGRGLQLLSPHWNMAAVYLSTCIEQGRVYLDTFQE